ncbi:VOC family protein [Rhodococcus ruber]|uniref:VOC family protein n=1 Tax=Rhodococcus ruber TaxID=1830 RepID=A0ABT4MEP6_9NOCA|nr:VOC family protein [Rhodococcus ruber]MCZ4519461.1 VOC family protein [Rhodococcus ruber]
MASEAAGPGCSESDCRSHANESLEWTSSVKLKHVCVNVSDVDRSVRFYEEALGFEKVSGGELAGAAVEQTMLLPAGARGSYAFLAGGDSSTLVELVQWIDIETDAPAVEPGSRGYLFLSFRTDPGEMAVLTGRIKGAGGSCRPIERAVVGSRTVNVMIAMDPDGNLIEFVSMEK